MIDDALASRLLAASWTTYFLNDPNPPAAVGGRMAYVGYQGPVSAFTNGPPLDLPPPFQVLLPGGAKLLGTRDAVTIGATATEIVVAFRGTLPFKTGDNGLSAADWFNDTNLTPTAFTDVPGKVHPGFAQAVSNLWTVVTNTLKPLLKAYPTLPVCFTGHSKGGAMAHIAAARFKRDKPARRVLCCTFAAARAGDLKFVLGFNAAVSDSRRYEYGNDVVPHLPANGGVVAGSLHLPPEIAALAQSYVSAGELFYLKLLADGAMPGSADQPQGDGEVNDVFRIAAIGAAIFASDYTVDPKRIWVSANHSIDPGSGYDRWIHRP